eukprot:3785215-Rhodomonas_salina.1
MPAHHLVDSSASPPDARHHVCRRLSLDRNVLDDPHLLRRASAAARARGLLHRSPHSPGKGATTVVVFCFSGLGGALLLSDASSTPAPALQVHSLILQALDPVAEDGALPSSLRPLLFALWVLDLFERRLQRGFCGA